GSSPIPKSLVASCVRLQLRPLSSTGITRLPRSYGPLRHPSRPSLTLTSRRLIQLRSPLGFPVLPLVPVACMPSPLPRRARWTCSLVLFHRPPVATGWNEPAPGRDFHPLWTSAFPRRTHSQCL